MFTNLGGPVQESRTVGFVQSSSPLTDRRGVVAQFFGFPPVAGLPQYGVAEELVSESDDCGCPSVVPRLSSQNELTLGFDLSTFFSFASGDLAVQSKQDLFDNSWIFYLENTREFLSMGTLLLLMDWNTLLLCSFYEGFFFKFF